ncbi:hypothetical protein HS1genome_0934 [Sulfodiicoccus acidiphilus]|uniref:DUF711 domain-containing protein n=1 Tax=Sulfodiicoccus acidiphilus TaxID=1670455 RepID=A0A348B2Z3_9CREN|nr:DUF711 family protein [Sulfodiicoccus acidiphilus]BBD72545.1 hypothetical protein HS1genome_0934 [Sulfodiicoccus acidiphilus]GGT93771.1 hypothetical protein GCM10007116_09370 [Sulfodiicoccus acidiphilus]
MKLRALTYFVSSLDRVAEVSDSLSAIQLDVWSKRVALPPTPREITTSKLVELPLRKELIYALVHLRGKDPRVKDVPDLLRSVPNSFGSILVGSVQQVEEVASIMSKLEPEEATRLLILLNHDFLLTPYFPAACSSGKEGVGVALLYVQEFKEGRVSESLRIAEEVGIRAASSLGTKFLGVDPSLSPWMDESVGALIEENSGKLFSPGNMGVVMNLNRKIEEASNLVDKRLGFSEVMLPVGEDNVLKSRVEEGTLTLSSLISLTAVCAAGLDMVALGEVNLKSLLLDLLALRATKGRPYGVRVIPTGLKYGSVINLDQFGRIPIVKVV